MSGRRWRKVWWLGVLLLLWGCAPRAQGKPTASARAVQPSPVVLPSPTATPPPSPSPIAAAQPLAAATPVVNVPTPAPQPLQVVFPTPGPTPRVPWRPPMYPVPWAPTLHDHFFLARPIPAFYGRLPTTDYRYGGAFFRGEVHTGIDIPGDPGTPVLAAGRGQVIWAGYGLNSGHPGQKGPYGLAVMLRHDFGWQGRTLYTVYAHLSEVDVRPGWWVDAGTPLGRMGNTGHTTGPHLHFEVRLGSFDGEGKVSFESRNPELWLVPPVGWGILVGQVLDSWGRPLSHNIVYIASLEDKDFHWRTYTYVAHNPLIHSDPYYRENYVFGDLPAGKYRLTVPYGGNFFSQEFTVRPGRVTFFRFKGWGGFQADAQP